jgi:acetyltransferase-like isoleucine patch superfamily enzyme
MFGKVICKIRLFVLKIIYGKRLKIDKAKQIIRADTEIYIGKDAFLSIGSVNINTNVHLICEHGEMTIGRGVIFNMNCITACWHKIEIGNNCIFGPNVCMYDHDHMFGIYGVSKNEFTCSEIIIEDGCWIGAGVIILRGTHIGRNSVIGAGTVVKGVIPPNSLVFANREVKTIPLDFFSGISKESDIIKAII